MPQDITYSYGVTHAAKHMYSIIFLMSFTSTGNPKCQFSVRVASHDISLLDWDNSLLSKQFHKRGGGVCFCFCFSVQFFCFLIGAASTRLLEVNGKMKVIRLNLNLLMV